MLLPLKKDMVYFLGTTMEIRVTRPFIAYFIPGDQYGGPDCFISCLHILFTKIKQIKSNGDITYTAVQRQRAVTVWVKSEQLLPFA